MGITAGSREVPGRNACDRRHTYCIITIIIIIIIIAVFCVCSILTWFAGTKHVFFKMNTVGLDRGQLQAPAALPPAEGVASTN